jgi:hypothetical protein
MKVCVQAYTQVTQITKAESYRREVSSEGRIAIARETMGTYNPANLQTP